ncbi:U-box domain-containing protein 33-like isoform X2 [Primulina eburnea]|uniref:U-box domain-containing protein 33-like isoform X2 n=1 Tax=Primulina eburnea TaxID=1245227 RepID=UPI003C6CA640
MAELLSYSHDAVQDLLSGSSPEGDFCQGFGQTMSSQLLGGGSGAVHVAVGKSVEKAVALLQWSFNTFQGDEICLLHVHRPSPLIPTLLGKLPKSQANPETVTAFINQERREAMKLLSNYLMKCSRARVKASVVTIEADEIHKGIVHLVVRHAIKKLVIGSIPKSHKASYAAKHAPSYCEMWFVNEGKLICTRQATESSISTLPNSDRNEAETYAAGMTPSAGLLSVENLWDPLYSESASSRNRITFPECTTSSSSTSSFSGCTTSDEPAYSVSRAKFMEESLLFEHAELKMDVNELSDEANLELVQSEKLGAEAIEGISKVKSLEDAHSGEVKHHADSENAPVIQEQEKLLKERDKMTCQLQKTVQSISLLESRARETNLRCEEVSGELKFMQASIASVRQEKQKLRRQKNEEMKFVDRWRGDKPNDDSDQRILTGFAADASRLPEFSLSDLEIATCNFSESFRVGKGSYGTVYKGELEGKTVAVKKLHSYNMQRPTEFHKIAQVFAKIRNPRVVDLIGVCPGSLSLVYEYLPCGSLKNHLFNNNICHLNWKVRTRMVADIATGLLILHSFEPEKIVHGNLNPGNILLDSEYRCKLGDYGDHMLVASQTLRCPSFRHCTGSSCDFGYTDPEFHRTGMLTHKSDMYSFGLIILQLVTGKMLGGLVAQVRRAVSDGKVVSVLDLSAGDWCGYIARRLVELGLQCCGSSGRDRPEMTPSLVEELDRLCILEEQTVPSFFLCPILQEIMHNPQVAADGFTYEGDALRGWLGNGHETSPMTNLKLSHLNLTPNYALKLAIQDWLLKS